MQRLRAIQPSIYTYRQVYTHTYIRTYIHTIQADGQACMQKGIPYIQGGSHPYRYTCIHRQAEAGRQNGAYIQTDIHTCTYTYTDRQAGR